MTHDEIRTFIERFARTWERADVRGLVDCYTPDAHIDSPLFHAIKGRADIEKSFRDLFRAFADWEFRIDDIVIDAAGGEKAVFVYTSHLTHKGDVFGMPGTGRRVESTGAFVFSFEDGRIASERRLYDFTGVLVQLGILKAKAV